MKILLIGEYSSLHWTLAEGLRQLGHSVTVASDGDGFKDYPRNIDLSRKSSSIKDTLSAIFKVYKAFRKFKDYDVVQLINPCFTTLSVGINQKLYNTLRKNNKKVFLGAFGDDSFWLKACLDNSTFRYSEFFVNGIENHLKYNERIKQLWGSAERENLNKNIAESCDGIIACLCEYYMAYKPYYDHKLTYIPLPFDVSKVKKTESLTSDKVIFFIGINKDRSEFKGTDRMYNVLQKLKNKYPDNMEVIAVESLPYSEYIHTMENSDVVLDQLYSYSPAMNGLLTLSMGKVLVSGAEPEMYDLLSEKENKPIVNVFPSEEDMYNKLENLILNKQEIPKIAENSRIFVEKYHDHIKVAQQYIDFWTK